MVKFLAFTRLGGVKSTRRGVGVSSIHLAQRHAPAIAALIGPFVAVGCSLAPQGANEERALVAAAGVPYEPPVDKRSLPELPAAPTWREVLRRAFLANGDLEAAYFGWKAAVQRIDAASAYPNANISLGFDYMFSSERMKSFDRATFSAGFDPAMSLTLPVKVEQAGKLALSEARVAGEKFRVAKFELQRRVLRGWAEYLLQARTISLREEDLALRRMMVEVAARGAGAGMPLREAQAAELELRMSENELLDLRSEHDTSRAALNALMGREATAAIGTSAPAPETRSLPADDAVLIKAAADVFPEVAVMAREVEGRADALELARLRWIPDISPTASFTGTVSQALGAMITLPTTVTSIRAGISEAEANLRASQAILRQRSSDRVGEYVSLLVMYRNAERERAFLERVLLPAATRLSQTDLRAYETGAASFADIVESRRTLLKVRELVAATNAEMDKAIVEIECCLGIDIEAITGEVAGQVASAVTVREHAAQKVQGSKEGEHVR